MLACFCMLCVSSVCMCLCAHVCQAWLPGSLRLLSWNWCLCRCALSPLACWVHAIFQSWKNFGSQIRHVHILPCRQALLAEAGAAVLLLVCKWISTVHIQPICWQKGYRDAGCLKGLSAAYSACTLQCNLHSYMCILLWCPLPETSIYMLFQRMQSFLQPVLQCRSYRKQEPPVK